MLKKERQAYILHKVNLHNKVLSSSLCSEINVSEDTIRRDLQELATEGKVIKVHGGALSHTFNQVYFHNSNVYSQQLKQLIAAKAIGLIGDGMTILTSGGSTVIEMARMLPPDLEATFISGSIPTVLEFMKHPNIDVVVIGDRISKNARITFGNDAIAKIKKMKADICFLGVTGIHSEHGITENDPELVKVKKAMIESSKKVVCLTISEKLDTVAAIPVCSLQQVDVLITELPPANLPLQSYIRAGMQVI